MATKDEPDLAQLADSYDILGRVGGADGALVALGTRRTDRLPVLVTVYHELEGDEGNALNHLASDAKVLAGARHPGLVPVLEARWLGHALAIVTERITAPTLEDLIGRREEDFPFPRIAAQLRDVNAVLEWARDLRIVHRGLRADSVLVEDGSDRVRVMFVPGALRGDGVPDARDDAATIARLARAMLTRSVADPERDQLPLAELRPGLPSRVVQQAEALLGRADSLEPVDVRSFIASIAMSEELRTGEDERARVTREMSDEQRVTREALAAERKAHEEDLIEQARHFEQQKEEILKAMAREREETARAMAKEREEAARALAREREESERQLLQERESAEKQLRQERERFDREMRKQREALEKERERIARARARMERDRLRFEKQRAAAAAAMKSAEATAGAAAVVDQIAPDPDLDAEVAPYDEVMEERADFSFTSDVTAGPVESSDDRVESPPDAATGTTAPARSRLRDRRVIGTLAVLVLLVVGMAALAIGRRGGDRTAQTLAAPVQGGSMVTDSLSGLAAPPAPLDSALPQDSATISPERPAPRRVVEQRPVASQPVAPPPTRDAAITRPDTLLVRTPAPPAPAPLPFTRTDSVVLADSAARRDTSVRRDSAPRDTVMLRRDTMPALPALPALPRSDSVKGLRASDAAMVRDARRRIAQLKVALGERGTPWWTDGAPDYNKKLVGKTPYAEWYAQIARETRDTQLYWPGTESRAG